MYPSSYATRLTQALYSDDYESALKIIEKDDFDPNQTNISWNQPLLSSIVSIFMDEEGLEDVNTFRCILKKIVKNDKFNPNLQDSSGDTVLMEIARNESFNWLLPFILINKKLDINITNNIGEDALLVAQKEKNNIMVDILMATKIKTVKGLPKKLINKHKIDIDKPAPNEYVISKIVGSFWNYQKKTRVSLYNLLFSFFSGDYTECFSIVNDETFDPNETDRWDEPVISSFIYYCQDARADYDEEMLKKLMDAIISNKKFDVNAIDSDCNSVLMVSMGDRRFNWLTEKLFKINHAKLDLINCFGETIKEIAKTSGNESFYAELVAREFTVVTEC